MRHRTRQIALLAGVCAAALTLGACDDQPSAADRASKSGNQVASDKTAGAPAPAKNSNSEQAEQPPGHVVLSAATLKGSNGADVGHVQITQTPGKGLEVHVTASGLPEGEHAIHFHEKGTCTPPDFKSAGAHWRPANWKSEDHAKDIDPGHLGTIDADAEGNVDARLVNTYATVNMDKPNSLFDTDGVSVVIHAKADHNGDEPGGKAGARLACAVIKPIRQPMQNN